MPSKLPTLTMAGPKSPGTSSTERKILMRFQTPALGRHVPGERGREAFCWFLRGADRGRGGGRTRAWVGSLLPGETNWQPVREQDGGGAAAHRELRYRDRP